MSDLGKEIARRRTFGIISHPDAGKTKSMRSKEEAHDYRYFPCPDLPPLVIEQNWVDEIKKNLPELPDDKKNRFIVEYGIGDYDAEVLTSEKNTANLAVFFH